MPGTNDHPGDYRASGCTACHVVYANDRSPVHSGPYAKYGNQGFSAQIDPTIPQKRIRPSDPARVHALDPDQPVHRVPHPSRHEHGGDLSRLHLVGQRNRWRTRCIRKKQHNPTDEERYQSWQANPEGAAARGMWRDLDFLQKIGYARIQQAAEAHAVRRFPRPRLGVSRRLQARPQGQSARRRKTTSCRRTTIPTSLKRRVHLRDIHLEKGMHCVDCHFEQDTHGNGKLYGETRNAVEVDCVDCHGTIDQQAPRCTLRPRPHPPVAHDLSTAAHALGPAPVLSGRTASCISARWSIRTARRGKWCRCWTPSRPAIRTTARNRAWRKPY